MQLSKSNDIISKLLQIEDLSSFQKLQCWVKSQDQYNIHIFSIQFKNEAELLEVKDDLIDFIAIYFQSQTLEKNIERWNIYQVFFVEESISKDIKQQIEQDKFATRKLVFDNLGCILSDEEIDQRINTEIFEVELTENQTTPDSLMDSLSDEDIALFSEIERSNGDINVLLKPLENE